MHVVENSHHNVINNFHQRILQIRNDENSKIYLRWRFHKLNTIKAVPTIIPNVDTILIQMNNGNDTVRSTRRTIVRSCGT